MATTIDNPYGYLVTPETADFLRRLEAAGRGVPNQMQQNPRFPAPGTASVVRNNPAITPPAPDEGGWMSTDIPPGNRSVGPRTVPAAPTPPAPDDIGPGVPIKPSAPVMAQDLPPLPQQPQAASAPKRFGFSAGAPTWTPIAPPSSSHKFDKPEFIYTNPVAAQQAAAQYGARLGTEASQDASYRDYLARINAERNANERTAQQTAFSRESLAAQQKESAANRASAEKIARTSELIRQHRQAEADWQQNERLWQFAEGEANKMNRDPNGAGKGIDKRLIKWDEAQKKWVPSIERTPRPVPPNLDDAPPAPAPTQAAPEPVPPAPVAQPGSMQEVTPAWPQASPLPPRAPEPQFLGTDFAPRTRVVVANPPPAPMIVYPNDPGPAPMIDY